MNLTDPLVTITIPFYNNQKTILDSIKSVFVQTYINWELILLDDGSTDDSLLLAKSVDDPRVKVISDGKNQGLVYRLNQIPSLSCADYLARLDADDMMHPERIEKQINFLLANPTVDLVDTGTYSINEKGLPFGIRGLEPIRYSKKDRVKKTMLLHASIMGKKQWFIDNEYDPDYVRAEDYELWCRTAEKSNFKRIEEPLYIVREGRVNIDNYIQSMNTINKIVLKYGSKNFTRKELMGELLKIKLKVFAYKVFGKFNLHHLLSKTRNSRLSAQEKKDILLILEQIKNVHLKTNE